MESPAPPVPEHTAGGGPHTHTFRLSSASTPRRPRSVSAQCTPAGDLPSRPASSGGFWKPGPGAWAARHACAQPPRMSTYGAEQSCCGQGCSLTHAQGLAGLWPGAPSSTVLFLHCIINLTAPPPPPATPPMESEDLGRLKPIWVKIPANPRSLALTMPLGLHLEERLAPLVQPAPLLVSADGWKSFPDIITAPDPAPYTAS